MITITPIHEKDGDKPYREFFQPEFKSQRLGKQGNWQGAAVESLHLGNPVQLAPFRNLLHGRTADGAQRLVAESGGSDRELGWRLTISAPQSLSVVWALAPLRTLARIESTHIASVRHALCYFEQAINGWSSRGDLPPGPHHAGLFAKFRGGAAPDQSPHLHTTVFLFNFGWHRDGTMQTFSTDQVQNQRFNLNEWVEDTLDVRLWGKFGEYEQFRGADLRIAGVPSELCRNFCLDPNYRISRIGDVEQPGKPLPSKELFARWQQQAEQWGWGPKEAQALLRDARRAQHWEELKAQWRYQVDRGTQFLRDTGKSLPQLIRGGKNRTEMPVAKQSKDQAHKETQSH